MSAITLNLEPAIHLTDKWYEGAEFTGSNQIQSATFPNLQLTAEQVLRGNL